MMECQINGCFGQLIQSVQVQANSIDSYDSYTTNQREIFLSHELEIQKMWLYIHLFYLLVFQFNEGAQTGQLSLQIHIFTGWSYVA